jgi:hypothetical protein
MALDNQPLMACAAPLSVTAIDVPACHQQHSACTNIPFAERTHEYGGSSVQRRGGGVVVECHNFGRTGTLLSDWLNGANIDHQELDGVQAVHLPGPGNGGVNPLLLVWQLSVIELLSSSFLLVAAARPIPMSESPASSALGYILF